MGLLKREGDCYCILGYTSIVFPFVCFYFHRAVSTERTHTTLKGMAGFYFSVENWIQAKDIYQELFSSGHVDLDSVLHYVSYCTFLVLYLCLVCA